MGVLYLGGGKAMPSIGLGTWQITPAESYHAVRDAIRAGYRHIDCAHNYGNESEVGRALQDAMADGVKREELWITSKLWNDAHHPESVRPALEHTLKNLRLDFLDLYLVHWPVAHRKNKRYPQTADDLISPDVLPAIKTWRAMENCKRWGLTQHIGVSNFSTQKVQQLLYEADIKPAVNQVESHPYLQQGALLDFCNQHGIHVTAYAPLGSAGRPKESRQINEPVLLKDPLLRAIASRRSASPAQVLIAWALQRGTAVIPKSANPDHMKQNLAATDLFLTVEEMEDLSGLDRCFRYIDGSTWVFPGSGYTLENLWDERKEGAKANVQ